MDGKRFDALTRGISSGTSRRGLLKGLAASIAGIAGVHAVERDATANGTARITIHNAQCRSMPKGDLYTACHDNGFGCVNFTFRGRTIRTNSKGVATARIGSGSFSISQQASRVRRSSTVYVYCSDTRNGNVLYDGGAPKGAVSFNVPKNGNVVCDWYNISKTDLAMPGQCSGSTTPTTTTTGRPRSTTTTTTTLEPCPEGGIWVEPGNNTLQNTLNTAPAGSVICLRTGTYTASGGSYVGQAYSAFTILGRGSTGPNASILDGTVGPMSGLGTTAALTVRNVQILVGQYRQGVDIIGATGDGNVENVYIVGGGAESYPTAGIRGTTSATVKVKNSTITNCANAVQSDGATVSLQGVTVIKNGVANAAIVIPVSGGGTLTMDSATKVVENSGPTFAAYGGGTITNNGGTISGNVSKYGTINLSGGGTFINNGGTIKDNTSEEPGAVGLMVPGTTNTFTDNGGSYSGNNGKNHTCDWLWDGTNCCTPSNSSCTTS